MACGLVCSVWSRAYFTLCMKLKINVNHIITILGLLAEAGYS